MNKPRKLSVWAIIALVFAIVAGGNLLPVLDALAVVYPSGYGTMWLNTVQHPDDTVQAIVRVYGPVKDGHLEVHANGEMLLSQGGINLANGETKQFELPTDANLSAGDFVWNILSVGNDVKSNAGTQVVLGNIGQNQVSLLSKLISCGKGSVESFSDPHVVVAVPDLQFVQDLGTLQVTDVGTWSIDPKDTFPVGGAPDWVRVVITATDETQNGDLPRVLEDKWPGQWFECQPPIPTATFTPTATSTTVPSTVTPLPTATQPIPSATPTASPTATQPGTSVPTATPLPKCGAGLGVCLPFVQQLVPTATPLPYCLDSKVAVNGMYAPNIKGVHASGPTVYVVEWTRNVEKPYAVAWTLTASNGLQSQTIHRNYILAGYAFPWNGVDQNGGYWEVNDNPEVLVIDFAKDFGPWAAGANVTITAYPQYAVNNICPQGSTTHHVDPSS